ncbi:MAG: peptidase M23, partial [Ruminococcus sp.]|nr:peptidase M23 [Ruminococcus sp.]
STGFSTGDHLHFEIRYQGYIVNPAYYVDLTLVEKGTDTDLGESIASAISGRETAKAEESKDSSSSESSSKTDSSE